MNLKVVENNLTFSQALESLKQGKFIKAPAWGGYWKLSDDGILDASNQPVSDYRYKHYILREDWQIVEEDIQPIIDAIMGKNENLEKPDPKEVELNPFQQWLKEKDVAYEVKNNMIHFGEGVDVFSLGVEWGAYQVRHQTAQEHTPENN